MNRSCASSAGVILALGAFAKPSEAQDVLYVYKSNATEVGLGQAAVVRLGDVDQDGITDFCFPLIVSPRTDAIRVCSGSTGAPLYTIVTTNGSISTGSSGISSIEACGDVDSDGIGDFAVGASEHDRVFVYSGATGALWFEKVGGDTFGFDVNGAGDVDADGVPDVVVGDRFPTVGSQFSVSVLAGPTGATALLIVSHQAGDEFGFSVDGATDLNGDGHDDLAIGAPTYNSPLVDAGGVFFKSGADGSALGQIVAFTGGVQLGTTVRRIGDATGDGIADFAAVSDLSSAYGLHRVRVISGATFTQTAQSDGFIDNGTIDLAAAGDFDGDGRADVIAGGDFDALPWGVANQGTARVLSGTDLHLLDVIEGPPGSAAFGDRVDVLGDLNQDGTIEMIVGAPGANNGPGIPLGAVQVISTCVPTSVPYGVGCIPTGGGLPRLSVTGCTEAGGNLVVLVDAIPSPALFFASTGTANLTLPGGCKLLIDPTGAVMFPLPGWPGGPSGFETIVPAGLSGFTVRMQAVGQVWTGVAFAAITTNGATVPFL